MKRNNFILFSLLLILLSSCSKDYCDSCNSAKQIKLFFHYQDKNGVDLLSENINSAILYIYDDYGTLVTTQQVDKKTLEENLGLGIEVPMEGSYSIACWANITDKTIIRNNDRIEDALVECVGTSSSDPLYFASSSFVFKKNKKQNIDINFRSKHVKFEVFVKGVKKIGNLSLEIENVFSSYNFSGNPKQASFITLKPFFEYDSSKNLFSASFNFLKPSKVFSRNIILHLIHPSIEGKVYNYDIINYIKDKYPLIDITNLMEETDIKMLIEFQGVDLNITIPDWEDIETGGNVG